MGDTTAAKLFSEAQNQSNPVKRARTLHDHYSRALDAWQDFQEGRSSKILLWTMLHQSVSDTNLNYQLKEAGAFSKVDTIREALGVEIKEINDAEDFFLGLEFGESEKSYSSLLDLGQRYDGDSHFVDFGRKVRRLRSMVEVTAEQYISFIRFGEVRTDWSYSDTPVYDNPFNVTIGSQSFQRRVELWAEFTDRLHESKAGQRFLGWMWSSGTSIISGKALLVPDSQDWDEVKQYYEESSYPSSRATPTLQKRDSRYATNLVSLATNLKPGLMYHQSTGGDIKEIGSGLAALLGQFIADDDVAAGTGSGGLVSSVTAVDGGSADDVVKLASTMANQGLDIAEAAVELDQQAAQAAVNAGSSSARASLQQAEKRIAIAGRVRVLLAGATYIGESVYASEESNVSSGVKSSVGSLTELVSATHGFIELVITGTESTVGNLTITSVAGKATAALGPLLTVIDIAWSIRDSVDAGETGDTSVAVGQALGGLGAATLLGLSVFEGVTAAGSISGGLAAVATGSVTISPVGVAIAAALILGGLALVSLTADSELETFCQNTRFGTNWTWQKSDPTRNVGSYHEPDKVYYRWNTVTSRVDDDKTVVNHLPEDETEAKAETGTAGLGKYVNYDRQASGFLSILNGYQAEAAYTKNKAGVIKLSGMQATRGTAVRFQGIEHHTSGSNRYELKSGFEIGSKLHVFGSRDHMANAAWWPASKDDAETELNEPDPRTYGVDALSEESPVFISIIHEPDPDVTGNSDAHSRDLPEILTGIRAKRDPSIDGTGDFDDIFGIPEDNLESWQINQPHFLEVALTTERLGGPLSDLTDSAGIRDDLATDNIPLLIRQRCQIDLSPHPDT